MIKLFLLGRNIFKLEAYNKIVVVSLLNWISGSTSTVDAHPKLPMQVLSSNSYVFIEPNKTLKMNRYPISPRITTYSSEEGIKFSQNNIKRYWMIGLWCSKFWAWPMCSGCTRNDLQFIRHIILCHSSLETCFNQIIFFDRDVNITDSSMINSPSL